MSVQSVRFDEKSFEEVLNWSFLSDAKAWRTD